MSKNSTAPAIPLSKIRRAGPLVFVSGQLPRLPDGGMCRGTIGEQTTQAVLNLRAVLEAEGLTLADVVKTTVWLTAVDHVAGMNAVYAELFAEPYPARSTVISGLVAAADIEIEAMALDPLG